MPTWRSCCGERDKTTSGRMEDWPPHSETKRVSIDDDALLESCWEIMLFMREKKGVICFVKFGEGKVLMMVVKRGSDERRWFRAVSISVCDVNGFAIVERGRCCLFLGVSFGIFRAGKGIFEEVRVLIGGCGSSFGLESALV